MNKTIRMAVPPAKRGKAYEQVTKVVRQQVFSGRLAEGSRLPPERDLSEQFGVSRVVVREAIRTLEQDGILRVQKGAGGGTFVCNAFEKPLGTSISNLLAGGSISLEHLFEMRLMLEPRAAALAAQRSNPGQAADLEQAVRQAEAVRNDSEALRAANLEFHRRLVALAENPLLSALCETVLAILVESLKGKLSHDTSLTVLNFHHRIAAAVTAGQADQARSLTEGDLQQLWDRYRKLGVKVKIG